MSAAAEPTPAGMTAPPPVLMFVPHYPYPVVGGLERQSHELAKTLRDQGAKVAVLAARFDAAQSAMETVEGVLVRRVYRSPPGRREVPWAALQLLRAVWQLRKQYRVLHVHQHSWAGLFCTWWGARVGYKVVVKLPNVGDYGIPGVARGRFGSIKLRMLKSAHCIVAMSAESCRELEAVGYPSARTLRVTNGIVASSVSIAKPTLQRKVELPIRVVFAGRLTQQKCVHHLLEAWALAMNSHLRPATLEIWGEGPLNAELQATAVRLGVSKTVAFCGHVPDVRLRLREMDLFVLASNAEGNSNAILEAMDACLPVVATRVGGTPMQLGAAGADWLVEPGDVQGLADRLVRLLADADLRLALGEAMRRRIDEIFSLNRVAQVYLHTYRRLDRQGPLNLADIGGLPT